ncbi:hypothetical protein LQT97_22270 [Brucella pseudogrignonensis]|uniref:hypothetical protein n=1 Tax=Brucella pseudogrignonensis TaxID=419475 RepID=UPI000DDDD390|nr:hypothetical protein [Brucella pseudogrignonensis]MCD4513961.1 hypothetical protein [Brucella pseudogrignonensis]
MSVCTYGNDEALAQSAASRFIPAIGIFAGLTPQPTFVSVNACEKLINPTVLGIRNRYATF